MNKKRVLLIAFLGILVLSLCGCIPIYWREGTYYFHPMNEDVRPFCCWQYYPQSIISDKQHQKIYIKEMTYKWEGKGRRPGNAGIFLKDESWDSLYTTNKEYEYDFYDSLTGEYSYNLYGISARVDKNVDLDTLFKGKKCGELFKYTVTIVYSIDDEPESTQVIECYVRVIMGKYSTSLMGSLVRAFIPITR